jgi:hypothetical protein
MVLKNWIILGAAVTAILAYTIGIPPSFSTEYTKSAEYISSINRCGNSEGGADGDDGGDSPPGSPYESLVDRTTSGSTDSENPRDQATDCANIDSQVEGEGNSATQYSRQR